MTSIIHAVRSGAVFVLNHHQQEMKKVSMRRENGKKKILTHVARRLTSAWPATRLRLIQEKAKSKG